MSWPPPLPARWAALAVFLLALILHVMVGTAGFLLGMDLKALIITDELGAILLAPLLVALLLRLRLRDAFLLRRSHASHFAVAVIAGMPLQLFGGALQELTIEIVPGGDSLRDVLERALEPLARTQSGLDFALMILGGVVLAAICEEILFRGLLLQLLARGNRWRSAIVITAFLFALFHLEPIGLIPRTLMGVYFALLVWRSGSIFPAMLAHGVNNLLAFTAIPLSDPSAAPPTPAQAALLAVGSGLVFGVVMIAWWRLSPPATPPPTDDRPDPGAIAREAGTVAAPGSPTAPDTPAPTAISEPPSSAAE